MRQSPSTKQAVPALRRRIVAPLLIAVATSACYFNSLQGVFVFDDTQYVSGNPAIRTLWPPYDWLSFCPTRPVVYFTFAVNYALHGYDVVGYHLVNVAIHLTTALFLFGIVRRTLVSPRCGGATPDRAETIAVIVALIWAVHPLGTQSVTYVYQRLESLAAMFAIGSLYGFIRAYSTDSASSRRNWAVASCAACYLAMFSKESVAMLPLIVLCYDYLYVADAKSRIGSRRRYHAAMFCSWGVLGGLMWATGDAYSQSGIGGVATLTPLSYALSQSGVILEYLRLSFIPTGLCLDRLWPTAERWHEYVPQTLVILGLFAFAVRGVVNKRAWSFPAIAFFLLLAPTSSLLPIVDLMFEHRMYLPLACVIVIAVGSLDAVLRRFQWSQIAVPLAAVVIMSFSLLTMERNRDYHSPIDFWTATAEQAPHNPRAEYLLARSYFESGRLDEGRTHLAKALSINPDFSPALFKSLKLLVDDRRFAEAEACLQRLSKIDTNSSALYVHLGNLRSAQRRDEEAIQAYGRALELDPTDAAAISNLGLVLTRANRWDEAAALFRDAVLLDPDDPAPHNNLGIYHRHFGRDQEALAEFQKALALAPFHVEARANLGATLDRVGRGDEALHELERAVADDEFYLAGQVNLGAALARRGRYREALRHFETAAELDPTNATVQANLAQLRQDLAQSGGAAPTTDSTP